MTLRIFGASMLLIFGVVFTGDPSPFWQIIGGISLVFVPGLIADHVTLTLHPRHPARVNLLIRFPEPEPNWVRDAPPAEHPDFVPDGTPPATEPGSTSPQSGKNPGQ